MKCFIMIATPKLMEKTKRKAKKAKKKIAIPQIDKQGHPLYA